MPFPREIVIASAARTPIGSFQGALADLPGPKLGSIAIAEAVKRAGIKHDEVDEVFMGCVLPAGQGQAPARQASLGAGLPQKVPCTTINKVCGSGMKAIIQAAQAIASGDAEIVVAGGMESMSNAPYYLQKARQGYRLGHGQLIDAVIKDGLWDVYNDFHMGNAAELCAKDCNVPRSSQDEFARMSYERALAAQKDGKFAAEIVAVEVPSRKGPPTKVAVDEEPTRSDLTKMGSLKPAFQAEGGTVTAANSSKLNDGASALVIMSADVASKKGIKPLAKIVESAGAAQAPEWFTTAPVAAIQTLLKRANIRKDQVDLWEINEAFAVVALACSDRLGIDLKKVNIHGGAVALGHPIGASGARIVTTLLHAMIDRNVKTGCAAICIGGGEATALLVTR
jgi:acetyl-CoA C-acetyltransferase